jgi:hypothetical protein
MHAEVSVLGAPGARRGRRRISARGESGGAGSAPVEYEYEYEYEYER